MLANLAITVGSELVWDVEGSVFWRRARCAARWARDEPGFFADTEPVFWIFLALGMLPWRMERSQRKWAEPEYNERDREDQTTFYNLSPSPRLF